jgi:hypothetical protein
MATLVVGGLLTLIAGIVLKVADMLVEGRGAWARRAITADVELYNSLPDGLRNGVGGVALEGRVEAALVAFSGQREADHDSSSLQEEIDDLLREMRFRREAVRVELVLQITPIVGGGIIATFFSKATQNEPDIIGLPLTILLTVISAAGAIGYMVVAHFVALEYVRRRWTRDGLEIPAKYLK